MDKRFKPLTPIQQMEKRLSVLETINNHPEWSFYQVARFIRTELHLTLNDMAKITKELKLKPTLVPTGMKCHMEDGQFLELSVRSSLPLKHWIILANGVGIIDADYYNNPDNEGHIYFQLINLSPFDIEIAKGDIIGQGVIRNYLITDDDKAEGTRIGGFGSTSKDANN